MKNLTTNATISEVPRLIMSTPYNGILSKYSTEKKNKKFNTIIKEQTTKCILILLTSDLRIISIYTQT